MNRRQTLLGISALAGHALFPAVLEAAAAVRRSGGADAWQPALIPLEARHLLGEVVETIIPATDTPGARAAGVQIFVDLALARCVPPEGRAATLQAIRTLTAEGFVTAAVEARQRQLLALPPAAFALLKELTILGYFSSEIGATQALSYDPVPGSYHGCTELRPGQKAWAT